jgi:hypothetical protein
MPADLSESRKRAAITFTDLLPVIHLTATGHPRISQVSNLMADYVCVSGE